MTQPLVASVHLMVLTNVHHDGCICKIGTQCALLLI